MKASRGWLLLCAVHGVASMLLWWAREPALAALTWQADAWDRRPWTLWTSAWVHASTPELITHQVGLGMLALLAWVLRPARAATAAWLASWPLVPLCLPLWPHVDHASGLSGVLHAGALIMAVMLLTRRMNVPKARRWGALLLLAMLFKLAVEQPWLHPVVWDPGNETSVVQAAHLVGAAWGLLLGLLASFSWRWPGSRRTQPATFGSG